MELLNLDRLMFQSTPPSGERSDHPSGSRSHKEDVSIHAPLRREERLCI